MQALRGVNDAEFLKSVGATREEVQELARLLLSLSDDAHRARPRTPEKALKIRSFYKTS